MPKSLTPSQKLAWNLFWNILQNHIKNTTINCANFENVDHLFLEKLLKEHRMQLIATPILKNLVPNSHPLSTALHQENLKLISRHFQQKKTLIQIAKQFEIHNIAYVSLKGPALNDFLYQNRCLRQSNDLDVLVTPQDALKAHQALLAIGFQANCKNQSASIEKYPLHFSMLVKDIVYMDKERNVLLELHFRTNHIKEIGPQFHVQSDIAKILIQNKIVNTLPAEENFLYLCLHGAKHHWSRLQWLIDLAQFIKKVSINWDKLLHLAIKQHCVRPLLELKILLAEFFTIEFPNFKTSLLDRIAIHLHLKYVKARWLSAPSQKRLYRNLRRIFIDTLLYARSWQKIKFLCNIQLNSQDSYLLTCILINKKIRRGKQ